MGFAQEMQNIGDNIRTSFDARMDFLAENSRNTKKFLGSCAHDRKAMARQLHTDLGAFTENLTDTVEGFRRTFRRYLGALQKECQSGHNSWVKCQEEMAKRRLHPYRAISRGEEKPQKRTSKSRKQ